MARPESRKSNSPHVRRGLNRGHKLESGVSNTDNTNKGSWHNAEPPLADNDGSDEDVDCGRELLPQHWNMVWLTNTTSEERKHEGSIASHLLRNLELEQSGA